VLRLYWDKGLHPIPEPPPDGSVFFSDRSEALIRLESYAGRAKALSWLSDRLEYVIYDIPITFASGFSWNYTYAKYKAAKKIGREEDYKRSDREEHNRFIAAKDKGLCIDLYDQAVKLTTLEAYEECVSDLDAVIEALSNLERTITEKFSIQLVVAHDQADLAEVAAEGGEEVVAEDAPSFSGARSLLDDIRALVGDVLKSKGPKRKAADQDRPSDVTAGKPLPAVQEGPAMVSGSLLMDQQSTSSSIGEFWSKAQELVLSGEVDLGLAEMARLAQRESCGRNRFHRKLLLAQVCMKSRPRLARTILEELAGQIDTSSTNGRQLT
jgi:hypothetical protein